MRIPASALSTRGISITNENRSDAVTVTTWVTLVLLIIVFLSREAIKFTVVRRLAIDDLFILAATICAVGLSVATLKLASDGLGVFEPLTLRRANDLQKEYYASNFLYIVSLGFAKLSLVVFFYKIHQVQRTQRRVVLGLGIFIFAWTIASLITIAFQCGLTRPWEIFTLHCYDIGSFWVVFCIIDMTTDVSLIMLSVNLVYYLKVKPSRKVAVVACFSPRTVVIGASLTRLVYLYPITPHTNPAFNLWIPVICTQVQASLSIVTACIPYMRPFFYSSEAQVPGNMGSRRHMMAGEESYTHFSSNDGWARGHKRGQGLSQDSTAPNSLNCGRTPDVSPRIPSPVPLSPLATPRLITPPNSYESTSRSPSERGLKLQIPRRDASAARRASFVSPQTASSHALSPDCMSPVAQPFLSSSTTDFFPVPLKTPRPPTPPLPCHTPGSAANHSGDEIDPEPPVRNSRTRFSLFPSPSHQAPRYSLVPQFHPQPPTSNPTNALEHSRSHSRSLAGAKPLARIAPQVGAPETLTTSPTPLATPYAQHHPPPAPRTRKSPPNTTNPSATFATIAYDDPLRTKSPPATALTTSAPIPAPIITAPLPAVLESPQTSSQIISQYTRPLIPSIATQAPRRRLRSESNPNTSTFATTSSSPPSHSTPPPSHPPPTGPLPATPKLNTSSPQPSPRPRSRSSPYNPSPTSPLVSPTSPTRQRNRRILTPRNSSRDFNLSPVSPVSPPTPIQFWREDAFGNGAGRTAVPLPSPSAMWEEREIRAARGVPREDVGRGRGSNGEGVSPLRSPRVVMQRF